MLATFLYSIFIFLFQAFSTYNNGFTTPEVCKKVAKPE
jgi:hypothetical protein